ncbi:MAG: hypothetical protein AAB434_10675 [Planctomycetota bacterium]|mgnify:CR=1 FL=1
MVDSDAGTGRESEATPSDAFRRASVLFGIIGLDLSSLLWLVGGGGFALLPPPGPATELGTSQVVAPVVVGLASILVVMYRRQVDARAGRRSTWLFRIALSVSLATAGIGGLALAKNLSWVLSMI